MNLKYPHVVVTVVFNLIVFLLCWFIPQASLAFFFPVWFYIGREIAQAERRYISTHGGHRADCPWYCGFFVESWNLKSSLDWILPLLVSIVFFCFNGLIHA